MSFHNPTRHELAIHEAGHAYAFAALLRHQEPTELGLDVDAAGRTHGWCRRTTLLYREVTLANVAPDARPGIDWQAAAEIVIAIAGSIAEFRHRHRTRFAGMYVIVQNADRFLVPDTFDVDGDFQRIRDTLGYIRPTDPLATFKSLIDTSEEIVSRNWPSVSRLARELLSVGFMGENALIDWFERHPAKRWDADLTI
jgi:hypothetical protein